MPVTSSAIQGVLRIIQSAVGLINAGKTKKEAALLQKTRPKFAISPEATSDLSLAESELSKGMSSRAEKAYNDLNTKEFNTSISAILKGGGSVNNVGEVYGNSEDGKLKLAMLQDNLRLNQINNLVRARMNMQEQRDKVFQINEDAPWKDRAQANADARQGAQKQISDGLNTAGSAVMTFGQQTHEQNMYNTRYGNPGTGIISNPPLERGSGFDIPATQYPTYNTTIPTNNKVYNANYPLTGPPDYNEWGG